MPRFLKELVFEVGSHRSSEILANKSHDQKFWESKKNKLQAEITGLQNDVDSLLERKKNLTETISTLTEVHEKVFKRVSVIDQVVDRVTRVNNKNIEDVNSMITNLKNNLK